MRNKYSTGKLVGAGCLIFIIAIAIGYGVCFGATAIVMWALCKLGAIGAWKAWQAAFIALIAYIVWSFLPKSHSGKSND